ncbi:hypothetical protein QE152_g10463 [Popillia japonica]|uniref:Uncharacterized protein n=1 Tax=Popillia japonica TaxID=7064 RepID=A0AAW1LR45_POPJA
MGNDPSKEQILERWNEHFKNLLNPDEDMNGNLWEKKETESLQGHDIDEDEVIYAIKNLKKAKSAGCERSPQKC